MAKAPCSHAVQLAVDGGRDGLDFAAELLLDAVEVQAIVVRDEVDGKTKVAETACATNTVEVRFTVLGEVEVDHHVDTLDVDTAREQVRAHQVAGGALAELMEHSVAVALLHASMNVEARVPELGDLLRQQLDAVDRVAKDDALVDLQLREQRVQAVHLLAFLHKCVVLRHTLESQFLHQVDLVSGVCKRHTIRSVSCDKRHTAPNQHDARLGDVAVLERLDRHRERGREQ